MTLHVETHGRGNPLVLLHGWAFDRRIFSEVLEPLAQRWRVHALDLPGHGGSSGRFRSLDEACDDVAAAIPEASIACGWSLGALVALRLARRHRHKVRALALVSATPCFSRRRDWAFGTTQAGMDRFAESVERDPHAALEDFARLSALGGRNARRVARTMLRDREAGIRRETLAAGLRVLAETDVRPEVHAIDVPVAVVHGTGDRVVPVQAGQWLARAIPRAQWTEITGAGHVPFLSDAARFVGALERIDA